jgi:hypothetical protein
MKDRHNGWSNYETWAANLWWKSDEARRKRVKELVHGAKDMHELVSTIKDETEAACPIIGESSLQAELLKAALNQVNWYELAEDWWKDENGWEEDGEGENQ